MKFKIRKPESEAEKITEFWLDEWKEAIRLRAQVEGEESTQRTILRINKNGTLIRFGVFRSSLGLSLTENGYIKLENTDDEI